MPNIFVAPDIEYFDELEIKVLAEFGEFRGIKLSIKGEYFKTSPAKYKDVRKQNKTNKQILKRKSNFKKIANICVENL